MITGTEKGGCLLDHESPSEGPAASRVKNEECQGVARRTSKRERQGGLRDTCIRWGQGAGRITREQMKQAGPELHSLSADPEGKCPMGPDNGEADLTA